MNNELRCRSVKTWAYLAFLLPALLGGGGKRTNPTCKHA